MGVSYNKRVPLVPGQEPSRFEAGHCTVCGGMIVASCPPFVNRWVPATTIDGTEYPARWVTLTGMTVYRCASCNREESPAERAASLQANGAALAISEKHETRTCRREECGETFQVPKRSTRTHCCRGCASSDGWDRERASGKVRTRPGSMPLYDFGGDAA